MVKNNSQSVAVVVPNWNGAKRLKKCLASLLEQNFKDFLVVVVDNNSKDSSLEILESFEKKHTNIKVLKNSKNLGFAGGVNTGIEWAMKHDFWAVALFNNDAVADKSWLGELVKILQEKPEVGIATGLLLHADGKTIDSTGDFFSSWGLPFPRNRGDKSEKAPDAGYVFSGSGGASLYRAKVFQEIGIFDEKYFAYYEDVDLSFRAQLAGYKVFYNPKAVAFHGQGETSRDIPGFTVQQTFRNLPLLILKNLPRELFGQVLPRFVLAYGLFKINALRHGKVLPVFKGVFQSMPLIFKAVVFDRSKIQKSRRISVKYIQNLMWADLPPEQTGLRKFRAIFTRRK